MHYVYLLRSVSHPDQSYVGQTADLKRRMDSHNAGRSPHTAKYRPWRLVTYLGFDTQEKALAFERYLKSGSGQAFARRRLEAPQLGAEAEQPAGE